MRQCKITFLLFVIPATLITGCASSPPNAGFADVAKGVSDRTGQRVVWNQSSEDDSRATTAVNELLAQPLTPERATQIALLNNPTLQAAYEDLGVAQADLVQAGLLKNPVFDADAKFLESAGGTIIEISV